MYLSNLDPYDLQIHDLAIGHYATGWGHHCAGNLPIAQTAYQDAIALLAQCHNRLGQATPPEWLYESAYIYMNLAGVTWSLGEPWTALVEYARYHLTLALHYAPDHPAYLQLLQAIDESQADVRPVLYQIPVGQQMLPEQPPVEQWYEEATRHLANQEYAKAAKLFQDCVDFWGAAASDVVFYQLGLCKMNLSDSAGSNATTLERMQPLADETVACFIEAQRRNPQEASYEKLIDQVKSMTESHIRLWKWIEEEDERHRRAARVLDVRLEAARYRSAHERRDRASKAMWDNRQKANKANSEANQAIQDAKYNYQHGYNNAAQQRVSDATSYSEDARKYAKQAESDKRDYEKYKRKT